MSGTYDKKRKLASKMMGSYQRGPVTPSDKEMSKRHLKHRAEVDTLDKKGNKVESLKKSIAYNEEHTKDHEKALKKAKKELAKKIKKQQ